MNITAIIFTKMAKNVGYMHLFNHIFVDLQ